MLNVLTVTAVLMDIGIIAVRELMQRIKRQMQKSGILG
jgi:hypothetical protein